MSGARGIPPSPARRLSLVDQLFLSLHWFSLNYHWGALLTIVVPAAVARQVLPAQREQVLGFITAVGALVALVVLPLAGALSDRSTSRLGRRRPFMIVGGILNVCALLALAYAPTLVLLAVAFWLVELTYNIGSSAYGGLFPDMVPEAQVASASGFMGLMTFLGIAGGGIAAGVLLSGRPLPASLSIIVLMVLTTALTVWWFREQPLLHRPPFNWREFLVGFWVDPRQHPDFAWLFLSRFLTMMGFYTLTTFLLLFLLSYLHLQNVAAKTGYVQAAVVLGGLVSAYTAARLSDRIGRRPIVSIANGIMGAVILVFLLAPSFTLMLLLGVVFGIGFGAFTSVDWALAVEVLPSKSSAAKDLGIWGISVTLPQVLAPGFGALLFYIVRRVGADQGASNQGYIILFVIGAVYFFLGALTIWKIRGTR